MAEGFGIKAERAKTTSASTVVLRGTQERRPVMELQQVLGLGYQAQGYRENARNSAGQPARGGIVKSFGLATCESNVLIRVAARWRLRLFLLGALFQEDFA